MGIKIQNLKSRNGKRVALSINPRANGHTGQAFCPYTGMKGLATMLILFLLIAGHEPAASLKINPPVKTDSGAAIVPQATIISVPDTLASELSKDEPVIQTGSLNPASLVQFAKTLVGTPYLYGSTDPKKGFDCSGFITYVFNHFNVKVPRSSVEFTHVGSDVNYMAANPGDLILFTGTDSTIRVVGHMGIIVSNDDNRIYFIHSSSGKQYGVIVTELNPYYMSRFVRVARVFPNTAHLNPVVPTNRLIVVDSARRVSKLKTIKLNSLDSTKNKTFSAKKPSKKKPVSKTSKKKKLVAPSKKTTKKTVSIKKKSSHAPETKAVSASKKKNTSGSKKKSSRAKQN